MGCAASLHQQPSGDSSTTVQPCYQSERSDQLRAEAIATAEQLISANAGKHFRETYVRSTLVSYGASCRVFSLYNKYTDEKVACKTIHKKAGELQQRKRVLLEIGAMKAVEDHPNAVKLKEVYEDDKAYYLIMEYCSGGELYEHIAKDSFTERKAAHLLRTILLFVAHCHSRGVAHMDIKPENIMFDSGGTDGVLKIVDFGASEFLGTNEQVGHAFGTVRYCSPEMARGKCGQKSDIWSVGVVIYTMLSGTAPFKRSTDTETLEMIKRGPQVRFSGRRWSGISAAAKECLRAMLSVDPVHRLTANQALNSPWLTGTAAPDKPLSDKAVTSLHRFAELSHGRRLLLGLVARSLSGIEANRVVQQFLSMDADFNGTIDYAELAAAAKAVRPELNDEELLRLFKALDVDSTGTLDMIEFSAALVGDMDRAMQRSLTSKSFKALDKRGNGVVTKDVLRAALQEAVAASGAVAVLTEHDLDAEFAKMDRNGDGVLSLEEFHSALMAA